MIDGKDNENAEKWITIGIRVRQSDMPTLNQRLRLFGFETMGNLSRDFILGKFPPITEEKQIEGLTTNNNNNSLTNIDGMFTETFYKNIDYDRMRVFYIENVKHSESYASSLVNYFKNYAREFFGEHPDTINRYSKKKRSWILSGMRNFGLYYLRFYNDDRIDNHISRIIKRYQLNKDLDNKKKVYLAEPDFVSEKVKKSYAIPGDIGFIIKVALLSGLRQEELYYLYEKPICNVKVACECSKLHTATSENKRFTIIALNWFRGPKNAYFTILPTEVWEKFRSLPSFEKVHLDSAKITLKSNCKINLMMVRKLHYNVMCRVMEMDEADILAGRAKSVSAKHYALHETDRLSNLYKEGWAKFGIVV